MTINRFKYPKGRVLAGGYFFDSSISKPILQSRVLALWKDGAKLYKFDFGFILLRKDLRPEFVENCLGAPLLKLNGRLSNVLLDSVPDFQRAQSSTVVYLALNGELRMVDLASDCCFDPAQWLDIGSYSEEVTDTLGEVNRPDIAAEKKEVSVREALGSTELQESSNLKKTLDRLEKISTREEASSGSGAGIRSLFSRLKRAFQSGAANSSRGGKNGGARPEYNPYSDQSLSQGIFRRIANAFSQYLMSSALAKAIGKAHAKHVQKMMDQFSDGNIDDALKNAIPLNNLQDALEAKNISLTLGGRSLPQSIQPYSSSASSTVLLEDNLLYQLRQMYEHAFKALDQQGNYNKAAFVLAELLRDTDRAVQYLEKHKQHKLAAELAEGQKLDPPRIVRQWVLAKDIKRAMEVAVIAGCYQEAITLLQNGHPEKADDLRWHCATLHFQAGDINTAVDIAWPIEEKRNDVIEWMKQSFSLGGDVGARHLLRLALFDNENHESYLKAIDQQFRDDVHIVGLALLDEIVKHGNKEPNKRIASIAARYYLGSVAKGKFDFDRKRWNQLCMIAGDLTLRADVRGLDLNRFEGNTGSESKLVTLSFPPSYGRDACDCVSLIGGKKLVAFGESGVELWNAKGELVSRFSAPCHNIIVSDNGAKALLLANRAGYQVVHQFDLRGRSVSYWLDLDIHRWTSSFDGHTWLVSHEDRVFILDVLSSEQTTLWSIKELPGFVSSIVRTKHSFSVCLSAEEKFEVWVYELPNLYLQERSPHAIEQLEGFNPAAINEYGEIVGISPEQGNAFGLFDKQGSMDWVTLGAENEIQGVVYFGGYIFVATADTEIAYIDVFPVSKKRVQPSSLSLNFEAAQKLSIRPSGDNLLVHSDAGRLVSINLKRQLIDVDFTLN